MVLFWWLNYRPNACWGVSDTSTFTQTRLFWAAVYPCQLLILSRGKQEMNSDQFKTRMGNKVSARSAVRLLSQPLPKWEMQLLRSIWCHSELLFSMIVVTSADKERGRLALLSARHSKPEESVQPKTGGMEMFWVWGFFWFFFRWVMHKKSQMWAYLLKVKDHLIDICLNGNCRHQ